MIKSSFKIGRVVMNALQRIDMLDVSSWGISIERLVEEFNNSLLEVALEHFETDKEQFYEPRAVTATTNFKFGTTGSYDAVAGQLTVTMTPSGSSKDIGKVITFADATQSPAKGFAGIITGFTSPNIYDVTLFFPAPTTPSVNQITVGDWLVTGDVLRLLQPNEIFSPENLELFDVTNGQVIDLVPYEEFNRRSKLGIFTNGNSRWARYMQSKIEFAAGSRANALGTLRISAYWIPPKGSGFNTIARISDKRIPEVEERLAQKILSIKAGQILPQPDVTQAQLVTSQLVDRTTSEDRGKVR